MHDQHNGLSEGQQSGNMQTRIGQNRPSPSFKPASVTVNEPKVQDNAVAMNVAQHSPLQGPVTLDAGASGKLQPQEQKMQAEKTAPPLPHSQRPEYIIPVEEILIRLHEVGIEKSKDSVQRYCREGALDCKKLGLFKRFFATEKSIAALIEKMQPDEDARNCIQVNETASIRDVVDAKETDAGASTREQVQVPAEKIEAEEKSKNDVVEKENLVDFLKEEIRVKNKQLEVKDTQIAAMLERDHETNILIRGLQNQLGETFAMLAGRPQREDSTGEKVRDI